MNVTICRDLSHLVSLARLSGSCEFGSANSSIDTMTAAVKLNYGLSSGPRNLKNVLQKQIQMTIYWPFFISLRRCAA